MSIWNEDVKMVKLLIENGANVNQPCHKNKKSWTPLHIAAHMDNLNLFEKLIEFEADPTIRDVNDELALQRASDDYIHLMFDILVKNGCVSAKKMPGKLTKAAKSQN